MGQSHGSRSSRRGTSEEEYEQEEEERGRFLDGFRHPWHFLPCRGSSESQHGRTPGSRISTSTNWTSRLKRGGDELDHVLVDVSKTPTRASEYSTGDRSQLFGCCHCQLAPVNGYIFKRVLGLAFLTIVVTALTILTWYFTQKYTSDSYQLVVLNLRKETLARAVQQTETCLGELVNITAALSAAQGLFFPNSNRLLWRDIDGPIRALSSQFINSQPHLRSVYFQSKEGLLMNYSRYDEGNLVFSQKNSTDGMVVSTPVLPQEVLTLNFTRRAVLSTPIPPTDVSWYLTSDGLHMGVNQALKSTKSNLTLGLTGVTMPLSCINSVLVQLAQFKAELWLTWLNGDQTQILGASSNHTPPLANVANIQTGPIAAASKYLESRGIGALSSSCVHEERVKLHFDGQTNEYFVDSCPVTFSQLKDIKLYAVLVIPSDSIHGPQKKHNRNAVLVLVAILIGLLMLGVVAVAMRTSQVTSEIELKQRLIRQLMATNQAEKTSNTKSQFLANMSHELRTPMAGIIGLLDLLSCESLTPEQELSVAQIRRCASGLLALVNNVLDISKVEVGILELSSAPFSIADELEGLVDIFAITCMEAGVDLALDLSDDIPAQVLGDADRFRQVMSNLLSNAVKFTQRGHVVLRGWVQPVQSEWENETLYEYSEAHLSPPVYEVSPYNGNTGYSKDRKNSWIGGKFAQSFAGLLGDHGTAGGRAASMHDDVRISDKADNFIVLVFEVEDTGCGIPPEKREEVFESFSMVDPSSTRAHGGSGLGLYIVRGLITLMGGSVEIVEKEGPGTLLRLDVVFKTMPEAEIAPPMERNSLVLRRAPSLGISGLSALLSKGGEANNSTDSDGLETNLEVEALVAVRDGPGKEVAVRWMEARGLRVRQVRAWSGILPTLDYMSHDVTLHPRLSPSHSRSVSRGTSGQNAVGTAGGSGGQGGSGTELARTRSSMRRTYLLRLSESGASLSGSSDLTSLADALNYVHGDALAAGGPSQDGKGVQATLSRFGSGSMADRVPKLVIKRPDDAEPLLHPQEGGDGGGGQLAGQNVVFGTSLLPKSDPGLGQSLGLGQTLGSGGQAATVEQAAKWQRSLSGKWGSGQGWSYSGKASQGGVAASGIDSGAESTASDSGPQGGPPTIPTKTPILIIIDLMLFPGSQHLRSMPRPSADPLAIGASSANLMPLVDPVSGKILTEELFSMPKELEEFRQKLARLCWRKAEMGQQVVVAWLLSPGTSAQLRQTLQKDGSSLITSKPLHSSRLRKLFTSVQRLVQSNNPPVRALTPFVENSGQETSPGIQEGSAWEGDRRFSGGDEPDCEAKGRKTPSPTRLAKAPSLNSVWEAIMRGKGKVQPQEVPEESTAGARFRGHENSFQIIGETVAGGHSRSGSSPEVGKDSNIENDNSYASPQDKNVREGYSPDKRRFAILRVSPLPAERSKTPSPPPEMPSPPTLRLSQRKSLPRALSIDIPEPGEEEIGGASALTQDGNREAFGSRMFDSPTLAAATSPSGKKESPFKDRFRMEDARGEDSLRQDSQERQEASKTNGPSLSLIEAKESSGGSPSLSQELARKHIRKKSLDATLGSREAKSGLNRSSSTTPLRPPSGNSGIPSPATRVAASLAVPSPLPRELTLRPNTPLEGPPSFSITPGLISPESEQEEAEENSNEVVQPVSQSVNMSVNSPQTRLTSERTDSQLTNLATSSPPIFRQVRSESVMSPGESPGASTLKGLHILVVEDTAILQKLAALMLRKLGARVTIVSDGQQAVEAVSNSWLAEDALFRRGAQLEGREATGVEQAEGDGFEKREESSAKVAEVGQASGESPGIDLVLMDCQMPVMDGYTATRRIRSAEVRVGRHTRIVALTAHAMASDEAKCRQAGMDGYLTKPINVKLLVDTILTLVKKIPARILPQDPSQGSPSHNKL